MEWTLSHHCGSRLRDPGAVSFCHSSPPGLGEEDAGGGGGAEGTAFIDTRHVFLASHGGEGGTCEPRADCGVGGG